MSQIIENLKSKSLGLNKTIKTGLIIQGGGMRASYSMGALLALEELGFSNSFDYVLGSSAGAINGAYFLAKQSKLATDIYIHSLTNNNFLNFFRLREILNVDYLIDVFTNHETALDVGGIRHSDTDLQFCMIQYPSAKELFFSAKEHPADIMELIKASATIPAVSNKKITINGEKYIDGAVVNPIPIHHAISLGCTDIVVILTRSKKFRRKPSQFVYNNLSWSYFKDWPKESKDSLFERFSNVNTIYDFLWEHQNLSGDFRLMIIAPSEDNLAGLLSKNKKRISENVSRGYSDAQNAFKQN